MLGMGQGDNCPFEFNFDAATFKVGDVVSYRIGGGSFDGMPFVGTLLEVADDHVVIAGDANDSAVRYIGTRESRPVVSADQI